MQWSPREGGAVPLPPALISDQPSPVFHPPALRRAVERLPDDVRAARVVWNPPVPERRTAGFSDIVEDEPQIRKFLRATLEGQGYRLFEAGTGADGVVTTAIEHKAVLGACDRLGREGFRVARIGAGAGGAVELGALADALDERTAVVSVMPPGSTDARVSSARAGSTTACSA